MGKRTVYVKEPWTKRLLWIAIDKLALVVCAFIVLLLLSVVDISYYAIQDNIKGTTTVSTE